MVSIITSLYRTDKYLQQFEQRLKVFAHAMQSHHIDFEFIAIANDATEKEQAFGKRLASEPWFKFENVGRESVFATFNRAFAMAKGDILGWWNDDDVRYPEAIVEAVEHFKQGADLVYFPFIIKRYVFGLPIWSQKIDKQIPEFNKETQTQFKTGMLCGPFFLFTKAFYKKVGPFDEQFKISGDLDFCIRSAQAGGKFIKAKNLGGEFRVDGTGLSAGANPRRTAENNVIYTRHHVWKKLELAEDLIIMHYRVHHLLHQGKYTKI